MGIFIAASRDDAPLLLGSKTPSEILLKYEMTEFHSGSESGTGGSFVRPAFLAFLYDMRGVCLSAKSGVVPWHDCSGGATLMVDIAPHCEEIVNYRRTTLPPGDSRYFDVVPNYVALLPLIEEINTACAKLPDHQNKVFGCFTGNRRGQIGEHKVWAARTCGGLDDIKPYIDNIRAELKEKSTTTDKGVSPHAE